MKFGFGIFCIWVTTVTSCEGTSNMCGTGLDKCENGTKYRPYDGSCNNLKHSKWGTSGSEYGRLLPAKYSDLNGSFPLSVSGDPLPNPRRTSVLLFPHKHIENMHLSLNAMAYGQFITHDLSFTYLLDPRLDQNTDLALLHIVYLREHLRIASELKNLNPHWNDERLYQETRNIVISIHQHISYDELLPTYFGRENLLKRKIIYEEDTFIDDYDDTKRPITYNEFAHGANRHFHSMIADQLVLSHDGKTSNRYINMTDWLNNPTVLEIGDNFDDLARGMQCQHSMANDKYHEIQMTSRMFKVNFPLGWDLQSIDIQRGRDHGLASYNDMREYCGLPKANNFSDFNDVIPQKEIDKLKQIYAHVDDVDLTVGGIMETHVPGAITGPTFFCILMEQYHVTRISDRYWYHNGRSGLTLQQLREINKSTISKLLCDNGRNITMIQPKGFFAVSENNVLVSCDQLPSINLTFWKEAV